METDKVKKDDYIHKIEALKIIDEHRLPAYTIKSSEVFNKRLDLIKKKIWKHKPTP